MIFLCLNNIGLGSRCRWCGTPSNFLMSQLDFYLIVDFEQSFYSSYSPKGLCKDWRDLDVSAWRSCSLHHHCWYKHDDEIQIWFLLWWCHQCPMSPHYCKCWPLFSFTSLPGDQWLTGPSNSSLDIFITERRPGPSLVYLHNSHWLLVAHLVVCPQISLFRTLFIFYYSFRLFWANL